jgi:phosphatidylinositol 4-kinase type 2
MVSMDNVRKQRLGFVAPTGTSPSDGGEPLFGARGGGGAAGGSSADLQLYVRDVRDGLRKSKRPVTVRSWSTIKDVKDAIQNAYRIPAGAQRLYFGPLLTLGGDLPNHRTLHDVGIYRSGETLLLDIKQSGLGGGTPGSSSSSSPMYSSLYSLSPSGANDVCISSTMMDATPRQLKAIVQEARRGFALGFKPVLSLDGSAGTYFLHDTRKQRVAVFKPADEEPYAENNPRGYLQQPGQPMRLRDGVDPGHACIREVAAFLLDHDSFSGVPMTTLAEARHPAFNTNGSRLKVSEGGAAIGAHSLLGSMMLTSPSSTSSLTTYAADRADRASKAGSFQEFIRVECTMDDISPSKISVEEVHKIAILDIRILNADRNAANLLVRRRYDNNELELVPIDHGYCLRSVADVSWMDWCWLDWPQSKQVRPTKE